MKTLVFVPVILCALILGSGSWKSTAATIDQKHRVVTRFDDPVSVQGVVLKGQYLFVHDDAAMNRGDACTFIYKGDLEVRDKLVASFHCTHIERAKTNRFVVRTIEIVPGIVELCEFQFSGETAGHAVPISGHTAVVPLAVH